MNRIIKFRAYRGGKVEQVDVLVLKSPINGEVTTSGLHCVSIGEGVKLMQFTGLKDSKGVEIYEGDVIKCIAREVDDREEYDGNYEVCFNTQEGRWEPKSHYLPLCWYMSIEVIGNVLESPELLTPTT